MRVPRGTTGFGDSSDVPPVLGAGEFKSLVYEVARLLRASVRTVDSETAEAKSFYQAVLDHGSTRFRFLQNYVHGYVGFASQASSQPIAFIDSTDLDDSPLVTLDDPVLSRVQLESRLEDHELTDLSTAELSQIEYWKPKRLGDLIFNHWD